MCRGRSGQWIACKRLAVFDDSRANAVRTQRDAGIERAWLDPRPGKVAQCDLADGRERIRLLVNS
jgi:hypothetical protein